jgi:hypothetical protein
MVGDKQVLLDGVSGGDKVVSDVLALETTLENQ